MITLNSGVVKSLVVEAEVSEKKTQVTIDVANKSASCRIDLNVPVVPGATSQPLYAGMSDLHVSVDLGANKPLVSTNNVTDVDAASAIAKLAIAKIKEIAAELEIV